MEALRLDAGPFVLRPHSDEDIDGVLDQCSDPASQRWTTIPLPYTREHATQFVRERIVRGWRQGDYLAFAVADAASDEYLGTIDLQLDGNRGGEVGFGLRAAARGRGAMTAAVRAVAGWAFAADGLGLGILQWRAQIGNWPSRRVAWRAGFQIEGTVRGLCAARGQRIDGWIGSLRPQDPREPATPWLDVPLLDGERCVLRRFRDSDVDAVVEGCTDPVTRHWLADLPTPYTAYEALAYIQSRENEHAAGRGIYWAAAEPGTDRCVGSFGLMDIQPADGSAEIGYWVHPAARARGVASEATRMIVRHAAIPDSDGGLGLRRLTLHAAASNLASQRVAENAGFVLTGRQRAAERLGDGSVEDLLDYDLICADVTVPSAGRRAPWPARPRA